MIWFCLVLLVCWLIMFMHYMCDVYIMLTIRYSTHMLKATEPTDFTYQSHYYD